MLLNQYGQPTLITREKSWPNMSDLVVTTLRFIANAPLLLCHRDGLFEINLPLNWNGCLYKSAFIDDEYIAEKMPPSVSCSIVNLVANETVRIDISNGSVIQLTLVSLDSNNQNFMFIIQDPYVNSVVTDNFTRKAFEVFSSNKLLQKVISDGVDVFYFNDTVFGKEPTLMNNYPSELLIRCFAKLLEPRFMRGVRTNKLPLYLKY